MTHRLRSIACVLAFVVLPLLDHFASAQTPSRITGTIRDVTGSVMPGVTVVATDPATKSAHNAVTADDGTFTLTLPPGTYTITATMPGFRRAVQTVEITADAPKAVDFTLDAALSQEVTVTALKRESSMLDVPFSIAAPTEQVLRDRGVEDIEGVAANVAGFTVQNLGPGQSQVAIRGVSAGQIVRDQPGVKEQVGVLPRRVRHVAVALHPGPRSLRCRPGRSAARSAGDALRLRIVVGNGPLHHQPA